MKALIKEGGVVALIKDGKVSDKMTFNFEKEVELLSKAATGAIICRGVGVGYHMMVNKEVLLPYLADSKYGELETYVDMAALFYGAGCSTGDSRRDVEVIIEMAALFNLQYFGEDWIEKEYMDTIEAWFGRYSGLLDLYGKE